MYIVTGGAGFIGSSIVSGLNEQGIDDILIVDCLGSSDKWKNLVGKKYLDYLPKDEFISKVASGQFSKSVTSVIHMGACSSTTERDAGYMMQNNYQYSRTLAEWALSCDIRFVYASSAAVYGNGALGFSDSDLLTPKLCPQNIYGYSKLLFDQWAIRSGAIKRIVGLRFFNVYGPNEYHKAEMVSVVFKAFHQISKTGKIQLFKSYLPEYADGEQLRDFVYIKDCVSVVISLMCNPRCNGVFNLGSGVSRTWKALASSVFSAMNKPTNIEFVDMPETIKDRYQYFTEADMDKLKQEGIHIPCTPLEEGVKDYVSNYLGQDCRCW